MNVVFWDLVSLEAHTKSVTNLKFLTACGDMCAVVVCERSRTSANITSAGNKNSANNKKSAKGGDSDDELPPLSTKSVTTPTTNTDVYTIQLRNAIGAVVDTKTLPFVPKYVSMSNFHIVAANDRTVYSWHFQSQAVRSGLSTLNTTDEESRGHQSKLRMFDIANTSFTTAQSPETFQIISEAISDPICSTTISDKYLVIGRKSGSITRFNLPHLTPENTYTTDREPARMMLNCTSTKLGLVDVNGLFSVYDLEARVSDADNESNNRNVVGVYYGKRMAIERKDVWDMRWSEDDAEMIVVMEKTKMVVFNGETAEEPVVSSAYLGRFRDLEVRVIAMDTLMMHPDKISRECVMDFETKSLREVSVV